MAIYDWNSLMVQWNTDILGSSYSEYHVSPEAISNNWLGKPGATEEQIVQAEERLGVSLPPSYRQFLKYSNGWERTSPFIYHVWSIEEVDWLSKRDQSLIDIWKTDDEPQIEWDVFSFGTQIDPQWSEGRYIQSTLEISDWGDSALYLLNPKIVNADGEWEAWFFANWNPGADVYPSFWEMMVAEHEDLLMLLKRKK